METNYLHFSSDMYHMISKFMRKLKIKPSGKDKCNSLDYCSLTLSQDITGADFLDYIRNNMDFIYQITNIVDSDPVLTKYDSDNISIISREFRVYDFKPKNMRLSLTLDLFGWLININSMVDITKSKPNNNLPSPAAYDARSRSQHISYIGMYLFNKYSDIHKLLKTFNNTSKYHLLPYRFNPRYGKICIDYKQYGIHISSVYNLSTNMNKVIAYKVINTLYDSSTVIRYQIITKE